MTKTAWWVWVWIAVAGLTACDFKQSNDGGLPIGVILPFSGEFSDGADQIKWTLELAAAQEDTDFNFIFRDDGGKPGRAAELVHELAEEGVLAIVGTMSSPCALAAAERAEALAVPLVVPMATHAGVTADREWVFRMCFTDPQQGKRMAMHAFDTLGVQRIAIVRDVSNDYSAGLADAFSAEYLRLGGRVVGVWNYRAAYDRGEDLARWVAEVQCDAIYLPLYGDAIEFVIDGTEPEWSQRSMPFLGGDGWHTRTVSEYLAGRTTRPSKIDVTAHFTRDESDPTVAAFVRQFAEGRSKAPTSSAALAYDLVTVLARATRDGVADRTALRDGLRRELAHFEGLTGDTFLDPASGNLAKAVPVLTWGSGDWHAVERP